MRAALLRRVGMLVFLEHRLEAPGCSRPL